MRNQVSEARNVSASALASAVNVGAWWFTASMHPAVFVLIVLLLVVAVVVLKTYWNPTARLAAKQDYSPVRAAQRAKVTRHRARATECERIEMEARASDDGVDIPHGHNSGFETLVVDVWNGDDFTLRHRAVGLGWLPFVGKPEHVETPEITRGRLDRTYPLNGDEKHQLAKIRATDGGRIALAAAEVAAHIHRYPVWHSGVFDDVHSRVDLVSEVTSLTNAAIELRDQTRLTDVPVGNVGRDDEIVAVYVQKTELLQSRADALLDRLRALHDLRGVVAQIQQEQNKYDWLDRANTIDDINTAADAVADSLHAVDLRDRARASEAVARIYAAQNKGPWPSYGGDWT
jgi:hypothetical protein